MKALYAAAAILALPALLMMAQAECFTLTNVAFGLVLASMVALLSNAETP